MVNLFFWLGFVNLMADLSFTGLITYYLMTGAARDKKQMQVSILGSSLQEFSAEVDAPFDYHSPSFAQAQNITISGASPKNNHQSNSSEVNSLKA